MSLVLIGGGARSGKSSFALKRAQDIAELLGTPLVFIATAERSDDEMSDRIDRHITERSKAFHTIEEPLNLAKRIHEQTGTTIVVDCLTLWISNLMGRKIEPNFDEVIDAIASTDNHVLLVTNEVGEGIVPMHPVSRAFRDLSGRMNQRFAEAADEVFFLRFGLAEQLK